MKAMQIRQPSVSGVFYPSDPTLLTLHVDGMLEDSPEVTLPGLPVAVIAPHAGYAYSGPTAAAAYTVLKNRSFKTAIIVSPSHSEYFNGISVYEGDAYRTPLGLMNIDVEMRARLVGMNSIIKSSAMGHRNEHAIEVHIPFLQRIHPEAKILPIVMGDQRAEYCRFLAEALAEIVADSSAVMIASSDLSHFYTHDTARERDAVAVQSIREVQPMRLLKDVADQRCDACGAGPIAAVMSAAMHLGATESVVLHQCTSGDVTGDNSRVVGYLSAALTHHSQDA
jgi:AmmeMemoRadiSam system protein B